MAVKYKEVKEVLETTPLNDKELAIIAKIEKFINEEIVYRFDGEHLSFSTDVLNIKWNPDNPNQWGAFSDIKSTRKGLMKKELMKRYEDAGWEWEFQEGEDDGPNRPAIDWWYLKGK